MKRRGFIRALFADALGVAALFGGLIVSFYIAHGVGL